MNKNIAYKMWVSSDEGQATLHIKYNKVPAHRTNDNSDMLIHESGDNQYPWALFIQGYKKSVVGVLLENHIKIPSTDRIKETFTRKFETTEEAIKYGKKAQQLLNQYKQS